MFTQIEYRDNRANAYKLAIEQHEKGLGEGRAVMETAEQIYQYLLQNPRVPKLDETKLVRNQDKPCVFP
jgi:hypothetical protein